MPVFHGRTHIGRRALNEDRFVADAGWGLALVSDGMGGREAGEVAAGIVTAGMVDHLDQGLDMAQAVERSHADVREAAEQGRGRTGMGATLVAARFEDHDFCLAWIGDSRAYLWNGELRQLTRDHSRIEQRLASGELRVDQAQQARDRHLITRAMGLNSLAAADVPTLNATLARDQHLLLCSDGLSDVVSAVEIARVLATDAPSEDKVATLVDSAVTAGGADNITVVLVTADAQAPAAEAISLPPAVAVARADGFFEYYPPDPAASAGSR